MYELRYFAVSRFAKDNSIWIFDSKLSGPILENSNFPSILYYLSLSPNILEETVIFPFGLIGNIRFVEQNQKPLSMRSSKSLLNCLINSSMRSIARTDTEKRQHDLVIKKMSWERRNSVIRANESSLISKPCFFEEQSNKGEFSGVHAINNLFQYNAVQINSMFNFGKSKSKLPSFKNIELYRLKSPRGKFHSKLIETYLIEILKCKLKILEKKENILSKKPIMLLICDLDHFYSARRFEENGDMWIFDSLHPYKRGIKNVGDTLVSSLCNIFESGLQKPLVMEVAFTNETNERRFESYYMVGDISKENKKLKDFKFSFEVENVCNKNIDNNDPSTTNNDLQDQVMNSESDILDNFDINQNSFKVNKWFLN